MTRSIVYCLFYLILFSIKLVGQTGFEINYQTPEDEFLTDGIVDNQGNSILTGSSFNYTDSIHHGIVFKVFPNGEYLYRHILKPDTTCQFGSITLLDNGNYMVIGRYSVEGDPSHKDRMLVMILNPELETVMEKTYLLNDEHYVSYGFPFNTLIEPDRNIVLANTRLSYRWDKSRAPDNIDYYFMRLNQQGDTLLTKGYETFPSVDIGALRLVPSTDTLMVIGRGYNQNGYEEMLLLDHNFNVVQSFDIGQDDDISGNKCTDVWLNSREFLMTRNGLLEDDKRNDFYTVVSKLNTSGEFLQELILNRIDTNDYAFWIKSMAYQNDSTIYIGVNEVHFNWTLPAQSVIYLIDTAMNLLGRLDLNDDAYYEIISMEATTDQGCILFGSSITNVAQYLRDVYIQKILREDFEIITQLTDLPAMALNSKAWPNPANDLLHINLDGLPQSSDFRLQIYNTAGQKYFDKGLTATAKSVQCQIGVLPAGTYVYQLQTATGQAGSGTFIKL